MHFALCTMHYDQMLWFHHDGQFSLPDLKNAGSHDPIFTQIQRSYWRETVFLWAETKPVKKTDPKIGSREPALAWLSGFLNELVKSKFKSSINSLAQIIHSRKITWLPPKAWVKVAFALTTSACMQAIRYQCSFGWSFSQHHRYGILLCSLISMPAVALISTSSLKSISWSDPSSANEKILTRAKGCVLRSQATSTW